jgi:acyl-coenzyme A synthetase/AMP-(fatty) acid ligase
VLDLLPDGEYPDLQVIMAGGDELPAEVARSWIRPGLRLVNGYGPTEATTYATYHVMTDPAAVTDPVPLGRPTPGTRLRVLDAHRQPVPVGVVGQLHLGGPGLATGYLDLPDLTAARFVPDPFGAPEDRLYATGDLVRWRPDGALEFAGRVDAQVKIFGHRVEPGEIEAVLRDHPDVAQAVVVRREDRPGHPYLAAYYTTAPERAVPARELTDLAAARLPAHMVPRVCVPLDRIPVTAGGKTDRAALPVPDPVREPPRATGESDDLGAVRDRIAAIWREVVVLDAVDPDQRLFDLGGGSLHAARIHQRVADHYGLTGLRLIDLFSHPTVRAYAAHVHRLRERERSGAAR